MSKDEIIEGLLAHPSANSNEGNRHQYYPEGYGKTVPTKSKEDYELMKKAYPGLTRREYNNVIDYKYRGGF